MIDDFSYHQIFGSAISYLFFSTSYIVGENALHKLFTGAKLNELKKITELFTELINHIWIFTAVHLFYTTYVRIEIVSSAQLNILIRET